MSKSTTSVRGNKPDKPSKDFPLTPHNTGRWCKKIKGKLHYFGSWDDPDGALSRFEREWPYLKDGRTPPPVEADVDDGCTVRTLCNAFLNSKRAKLNSGELSERSFRDYHKTCERLVTQFGRVRRVDDLRPDDFEKFRSTLAKRLGVVSLKNEINRCRVVLKYAHDQGLIDKPVRYGQSFDRPSVMVLRKARNEAGQRLFEASELQTILDALDGKAVIPDDDCDEPKSRKADPVLKAMVLLGVNCGFGNTDVASLPQSAVDLEGRWIEFPRPKTGIPRRIPLWEETVAALRDATECRPKAKDRADSNLCFLTQQGRPFVRVQLKSKPDDEQNFEAADDDERSRKYVPLDALSPKFSKLLRRLKINGRRGLGFYTLRHTFETVAGESRDQVAVDSIMGHVDTSMAAVYRERISDERLQAVVEVVRKWLWPDRR